MGSTAAERKRKAAENARAAKARRAIGGGDPPTATSPRPLAVTLEIPVPESISLGYRQQHLQVQLTRREADGLRCLLDGAMAAGMVRQNGRPVVNGAGSIEWILGKIADVYAASRADAEATL